MDQRRAAAALLALAACFACATAAPTSNNQTALDLYDGPVEGCYYNFQHYGEGDRIMTNEPCLNCTCHNRMLMCYLRVCPFTKPIGQDCTVEKRADQCCPIVTCPDVPVDLLTSTSTTSPAEYGATGLGKLDKYGCSINGKYFPEGSKVPPSPNKPCEHCYCIRNMTTCVMQECTLHVDGCTPIYHKDVCCPIRYSCDHAEDEIPLLDDMTTTVRPTPGFLLTTTTMMPVTQASQDCIHDDQIFRDGALIKTEKACEHCYCMKGDIVCVVQECGTPMENEGKNCTSLPPRQGQCCPDTYICEGDETPTTELFNEITTLSPPRRVGSEGSGYRNEPDETDTEVPTLDIETEGSGEDQLITTIENSFSSTSPKDILETTSEHVHIYSTQSEQELNTIPDSRIEGDSQEIVPAAVPTTMIDYKLTTSTEESSSNNIAETTVSIEKVTTEEVVKSTMPELTTKSTIVSSEDNITPLDEEFMLATKLPDRTESTEFKAEEEFTTIKSSSDNEQTLIDTDHTTIKNEISNEYITSAVTEKGIEMETTPINVQENEIGEDIIPGRIPGEGDCLLNGVTYKNNSAVPNTNKCHTSCKCVSSIIKCEPIICTPPLEYMENMNDCHPVYDSTESCCPTYICNTKETIAPESHSQMSGTESPKPTIECVGDECRLSEESKPIVPPGEVNKGECGDNGCKDTSMPPTPLESCSNGDCETESEVKQPETEVKQPGTANEPCNSDDGCQVPVVQTCDGENCKTDSEVPLHEEHHDEQKPTEDTLQSNKDNEILCKDENCRRKEFDGLEHKLQCSGTDCIQQEITPTTQVYEFTTKTNDKNIPHLSTDDSDLTPSPSTSKPLQTDVDTEITESFTTEYSVKVPSTSVAINDEKLDHSEPEETTQSSIASELTTKNILSEEGVQNTESSVKQTNKPDIESTNMNLDTETYSSTVKYSPEVTEQSLEESSTLPISDVTYKTTEEEILESTTEQKLVDTQENEQVTDTSVSPDVMVQTTVKSPTEDKFKTPTSLTTEKAESVTIMTDITSEDQDEAIATKPIETITMEYPAIELGDIATSPTEDTFTTPKPLTTEKDESITVMADVMTPEDKDETIVIKPVDMTTMEYPAIELGGIVTLPTEDTFKTPTPLTTEKDESIAIMADNMTPEDKGETIVTKQVETTTIEYPAIELGGTVTSPDSDSLHLHETSPEKEVPVVLETSTLYSEIPKQDEKHVDSLIPEIVTPEGEKMHEIPTTIEYTEITTESEKIASSLPEHDTNTEISIDNKEHDLKYTQLPELTTQAPEISTASSGAHDNSITTETINESDIQTEYPIGFHTDSKLDITSTEMSMMNKDDVEKDNTLSDNVEQQTEKSETIQTTTKESSTIVPLHDVAYETGISNDAITTDSVKISEDKQTDSVINVEVTTQKSSEATYYETTKINLSEDSLTDIDTRTTSGYDEETETKKTSIEPSDTEQDVPSSMSTEPSREVVTLASTKLSDETTEEKTDTDLSIDMEHSTILPSMSTEPSREIETIATTIASEETTDKKINVDQTADVEMSTIISPMSTELSGETVTVATTELSDETTEKKTDLEAPLDTSYSTISPSMSPELSEVVTLATTILSGESTDKNMEVEQPTDVEQSTIIASISTDANREIVTIATTKLSDETTEKKTDIELPVDMELSTIPQSMSTEPSREIESLATTILPDDITEKTQDVDDDQHPILTSTTTEPSKEIVTLATTKLSDETTEKKTDIEIPVDMELSTISASISTASSPETVTLATMIDDDAKIGYTTELPLKSTEADQFVPQDENMGNKPVNTISDLSEESYSGSTVTNYETTPNAEINVNDEVSTTYKPDLSEPQGEVSHTTVITDTNAAPYGTTITEKTETTSHDLRDKTETDTSDRQDVETEKGILETTNIPDFQEKETEAPMSLVTHIQTITTSPQDMTAEKVTEAQDVNKDNALTTTEKQEEPQQVDMDNKNTVPETELTTGYSYPKPTSTIPDVTRITENELTTKQQLPSETPTEKITHSPTTQYDEEYLVTARTTEKSQFDDEIKPNESDATSSPIYTDNKITEVPEEEIKTPDTISTIGVSDMNDESSEKPPQYTQGIPNIQEVSYEASTQEPSLYTNQDETADRTVPTENTLDIKLTPDATQRPSTGKPVSFDSTVSSETESVYESELTTKSAESGGLSTETYPELQTEQETDSTIKEASGSEKPQSFVTTSKDIYFQTTESGDIMNVETKTPQDFITSAFDENPQDISTKSSSSDTVVTSTEHILGTQLPELDSTTVSKSQVSETTPYFVELEEHTHQVIQETTVIPVGEYSTVEITDVKTTERGDQLLEDSQTEKSNEVTSEAPILTAGEMSQDKHSTDEDNKYRTTTISALYTQKDTEEKIEEKPAVLSEQTTASSVPNIMQNEEQITSIPVQTEKPIISDTILTVTTEKTYEMDVKEPEKHVIPLETKLPEDEIIHDTTPTTPIKSTTAEEIAVDTGSTTPKPTTLKPIPSEPTEEIPSPDFPPSGYDQEPDYGEEDQAFGPGTCRYGGKVYVSAQQIPRDDPCDFCFCFRSDIICLQQSCPPPIHGCHEEPIQGFCCPRYECPVSMATTVNVTTTTTTTTTTLPPHFLPHAYKGAAQRKGCHIKGHSYKVGEVVRASSGPCLHCTCGGDGQMKCDPKACTPEPMLRQMIAAAVSAKRRR